MAKPRRSASRGSFGNMSRGRFLRTAGLAGGAVAATGLGFAKTAKAIQTTYTDNPDPVHIKVISSDYIEVTPVNDPTRRFLWEANRQQDPRISVLDPDTIVWGTDEDGNQFIESARPMSDTHPESHYDPRRRTLDAMNIEWAANNVKKKTGRTPGTVVLKNTGTPFDFGTGWILGPDMPPGFGVYMCNDCVICGESVGGQLTTIKNGAGCFVVNWGLGDEVAFTWGLPYGPEVWHDYAASFTIKDLVLQDSMYPNILGFTGFDRSNGTAHSLLYIEVNNVRIINARPNPDGAWRGGKASIPIFIRNDMPGGTAVVKNCHVSTTNESGEFVAGIFVVQPEIEITGNEIYVPPSGALGIIPVSLISMSVKNNKITSCGSEGIGIMIWSGVDFYQGNMANHGLFEGNIFKETGSVCIWCDGAGSTFSNNDFTRSGLKGFLISSPSFFRGCIVLTAGTFGNTVNVLRSQLPSLPGSDPCTQIADLTLGSNSVNLDFTCDTQKYDQMIHMILQNQKYQELKAGLEAKLAALKRL